jgi:hypothetical protein
VKKEWILYFDQLEERNIDNNSEQSWLGGQPIFTKNDMQMNSISQRVKKMGIQDKLKHNSRH